jgi:hypothetical protein
MDVGIRVGRQAGRPSPFLFAVVALYLNSTFTLAHTRNNAAQTTPRAPPRLVPPPHSRQPQLLPARHLVSPPTATGLPSRALREHVPIRNSSQAADSFTFAGKTLNLTFYFEPHLSRSERAIHCSLLPKHAAPQQHGVAHCPRRCRCPAQRGLHAL